MAKEDAGSVLLSYCLIRDAGVIDKQCDFSNKEEAKMQNVHETLVLESIHWVQVPTTLYTAKIKFSQRYNCKLFTQLYFNHMP